MDKNKEMVEAAVQKLMSHIENFCLIKEGAQPELEGLIVNLITAASSLNIDRTNPRLTGASASPVAHDDHPMRHWDRTCPACNASIDYTQQGVSDDE